MGLPASKEEAATPPAFVGLSAIFPSSIDGTLSVNFGDILPVTATQSTRAFYRNIAIREAKQHRSIRIAAQRSAPDRPIPIHHFFPRVAEAIAIPNGEYYQRRVHTTYKLLGGRSLAPMMRCNQHSSRQDVAVSRQQLILGFFLDVCRQKHAAVRGGDFQHA